MAMRPRRAVDLEMEDGSAFIVMLLARAIARPANRTWTEIRLRAAGSLRCPDALYLDEPRRAIKFSPGADAAMRRRGAGRKLRARATWSAVLADRISDHPLRSGRPRRETHVLCEINV